jgi:hypothetical protein
MDNFEDFDFYEMLQVSPAAEPEVIESAYRKLAQKYHPDINKDPSSSEKMGKINIAHDTLCDSVKRSRYHVEWLQKRENNKSFTGTHPPAKPKPKPASATKNPEGAPMRQHTQQNYSRQTAKPKKGISAWFVGATIVLGAVILVAVIVMMQSSSLVNTSLKSSQTPSASLPATPPVATSPANPPVMPTDGTPPIITGLSATSIYETSAVINWTPNKVSHCQVEYGKTTQYGSLTQSIDGSSITIGNLEAGNTYHYRVKSKDNAGTETLSGDYTFTTSPPAYTPPQAPTIYSMNRDVNVNNQAKWRVLSSRNMGNVLKGSESRYPSFKEDKTTTGKFIEVTFIVENIGGKTKTMPVPPEIVDSQNREFGTAEEYYLYVPNDMDYLLTTLPPNVPKNAIVIYDLPQDATGLKFVVNDFSFLSHETALIDLGM